MRESYETIEARLRGAEKAQLRMSDALARQQAEIERLRVSEGKWRNAWSALHKIYADDTERLRAALKQIADEEYVNAPEATFIARKALNEQSTPDDHPLDRFAKDPTTGETA